MTQLSIKQLSAVRELASSRSFTVAASNLHITQSNLNMTIRDAEEIADTLFEATRQALSDEGMTRKPLIEGNTVKGSASREAFRDFALSKGNECLSVFRPLASR